MHTQQTLLDTLSTLGIDTKTAEHPAVFTVEEADKICHAIPGVHCKNLFLKDKGGQLWLIVAPSDRGIDLKTLPDRIGSKRLSFGNADLLRQTLGVTPGSVTPFSAINDTEGRVRIVLDQWMMDQPLLNYHPLVNTATTTIRPEGLQMFFTYTGHKPMILELT
jgi:Ala-tRNA(Pro) deacylase